MNAPHRVSRYGRASTMPSEIPGDYPAARPGEVITRQATPEELERVRSLEPPKTAPYIAHDKRGRLMVGWDL